MSPDARDRTSRVLWGLVALATVQVAVLVFSRGGPLSAGIVDRSGYDLGPVELVDGDGAVSTLATGAPLLVLVFHSECGHCRAVAPDWAEWLANRTGDLSVIAVSREALERAGAYADEQAWDVDVRAVRPGLLTPRANLLTGRTPWVFGLDEAGRVVSAAHGAQLERVAAELRAALD